MKKAKKMTKEQKLSGELKEVTRSLEEARRRYHKSEDQCADLNNVIERGKAEFGDMRHSLQMQINEKDKEILRLMDIIMAQINPSIVTKEKKVENHDRGCFGPLYGMNGIDRTHIFGSGS